jgi:transposase
MVTDALPDVRPPGRVDGAAGTFFDIEGCRVADAAPRGRGAGGVPARLVPDNLKTGVDKPDLYDPKINRSYAELAAHYGCLVDPARAIKPRDQDS